MGVGEEKRRGGGGREREGEPFSVRFARQFLQASSEAFRSKGNMTKIIKACTLSGGSVLLPSDKISRSFGGGILVREAEGNG